MQYLSKSYYSIKYMSSYNEYITIIVQITFGSGSNTSKSNIGVNMVRNMLYSKV